MSFSLDCKKFLGISTILTLLVFGNALAQVATSEDENPSEILAGQLQGIVANYIELKNAFVNNNSEQAMKESNELRVFIFEMDDSGAEADLKSKWVSKKIALMNKLDELADSPDIEEQRVVFQQISSTLEQLVKEFGPLNQTLYKQRCPKAFNGEGGTWLNEKKKILNPYGGKGLLHCGSIVEKFEGSG